MLTDRLVEAFLSCTLSKDQWTHQAHLRVGLWHLLHYSSSESLDRLRQSIKRYNVACGIKNTEREGYHETITQFYVLLIQRFLEQSDCQHSFDTLANELIDRYGDKRLLFEYYSQDRLMSATARRRWLEPDLQPLP